MSPTKIVFVLLVAGLGYYQWRHQGDPPSDGADGATPNGFVTVPPVANVAGSAVMIVTYADCPPDAMRRADALTRDLMYAGILATRAHAVNFDLKAATAETSRHAAVLLRDVQPIVLVRGRARSNPSLEEVVLEYRR